MMTRWIPILLLAAMACLISARAQDSTAAPAAPIEQSITLFDKVELSFTKENPGPGEVGVFIDTTIELPLAPANQRDAKRMLLRVEIEPILIEQDGKLKPGDPWTRMGNICIVTPGPSSIKAQTETELMRFITGYGGAGVFEQDVTALSPLLAGQVTFRLLLTTFSKPGWRATVKLISRSEGVGYRRPTFARRIFNEQEVLATRPLLVGKVTIPKELETPRLRVLTTGHATDGRAGNEFITCPHVLRVDGKVVATWRPWYEGGGNLRAANPTSGRQTIDGRELWSSDMDRSGWAPGRIVRVLTIPLPELTPGEHTIELEIQGIRPQDDSGRGFWRTSAIVVADQPWPSEGVHAPAKKP